MIERMVVEMILLSLHHPRKAALAEESAHLNTTTSSCAGSQPLNQPKKEEREGRGEAFQMMMIIESKSS